MKKKIRNILIWSIIGVTVATGGTLGILSYLGGSQYVGPFRGLSIGIIRSRNKPQDSQNRILFYGASNFRLWDNMEKDMEGYGYKGVLNHGFGGAMDKDLIQYASEIVYPYQPKALFIQTGSNDYAGGLSRKDVEENKITFYTDLRSHLPDTPILIMSGLPLPGRQEYKASIDSVNVFIRDYCKEHENFFFLDADPIMLNSDGSYKPEYFRSDQIHLNQEGHDAWTKLMVETLHSIGIDE